MLKDFILILFLYVCIMFTKKKQNIHNIKSTINTIAVTDNIIALIMWKETKTPFEIR